MKKVFLILAACITLAATAQTKEIEALQKRHEKSNQSIADPKKAETTATWIERAGVLIDMANAYTGKLIAGFTVDQVTPMVGSPESTEDVTLGGVKYSKYIYPNFDFYTNENGEIMFWNSKKSLIEQPLEQAMQCLIKAKQINEKEFSSKGIIMASKLQNQFQTDGMASYSMQQPKISAELFANAAEVAALTGDLDTTMLYYSGISYFESEQYEKAITQLDKVLATGNDQDGSLYYYLSVAEDRLGNKDKALALLEKGFEKYPSNTTLITGMINLYISADKDPKKLIEIIQTAQKLDPSNVSLYLTEGSIWDKLNDGEKAEEAFVKAIAKDTTNFNSYFNVGIIRARKGDALVEKASALDVNDVAGYNALIEQAIPFYNGSIEVLEKAHKLDTTNKSAIEMLRSLYYPKRDENPTMAERYTYFDNLYKAAQQ